MEHHTNPAIAGYIELGQTELDMATNDLAEYHRVHRSTAWRRKRSGRYALFAGDKSGRKSVRYWLDYLPARSQCIVLHTAIRHISNPVEAQEFGFTHEQQLNAAGIALTRLCEDYGTNYVSQSLELLSNEAWRLRLARLLQGSGPLACVDYDAHVFWQLGLVIGNRTGRNNPVRPHEMMHALRHYVSTYQF